MPVVCQVQRWLHIRWRTQLQLLQLRWWQAGWAWELHPSCPQWVWVAP